MRFIALIEEPLVIEKILRHLSQWCGPAQFAPARPPPEGQPPRVPRLMDRHVPNLLPSPRKSIS